MITVFKIVACNFIESQLREGTDKNRSTCINILPSIALIIKSSLFGIVYQIT